jgi:SAM-dependent methyltransferase
MTVRIVRDPDFGYLRIDPVPSAEEVDRFYREEFYDRSQANYVNDSGLDNMREEADYHRRSYADLLEIVRHGVLGSGREPDSVTVADVGCGFGYWLKYLAEHGLKGYGVEPVQEGINHCRSLGLEGYCVPIEALTRPPQAGRVALVTMINVLEHLREPADILKAFRASWLEPGGYVLLRVPNEFNPLQVTADRLHGLNQWWVVPPQHINYFSRESLLALLAACGYDMVDTMGTFPLEMFLLMNEVYVGDPKVGKQIHRKRVAFEQHLDAANLAGFRRQLYRHFAELGIGREIIVLAKARSDAA